jgi:hypothetical protein
MKKSFYIRFLGSLLLTTFLIVPGKANAQTDSAAKTAEVKEATTYTPLIVFVSTQKSDNTVDLKATVKAKINGTLTQLAGLKITFITGVDSNATKLGETMTDSRGVAIFNCKPGQLIIDAEGKLNFKANFAGKNLIEPAEELISVKRARLGITALKDDSLLSVRLKLVDLSTGTETAVPETELGVFVKRLFNPLKLGDGKTDETGEAIIEIPKDLPGDAKGNITLLARLDENDVYGNLEAAVVQQWGIPVSHEVKELPRALWSSHPPIWMLITFIILMTAVWGHYIVIIFELFRLRKEEPKTV